MPVLPAGFPVFLSNIYCILQMGYIFKTDRSGFRLIPFWEYSSILWSQAWTPVQPCFSIATGVTNVALPSRLSLYCSRKLPSISRINWVAALLIKKSEIPVLQLRQIYFVFLLIIFSMNILKLILFFNLIFQCFIFHPFHQITDDISCFKTGNYCSIGKHQSNPKQIKNPPQKAGFPILSQSHRSHLR